jgi:hypothetical protein
MRHQASAEFGPFRRDEFYMLFSSTTAYENVLGC